MEQRATSTFKVTSWNEEPFHEIDGAPRLTRARVTKSFAGEIVGESVLEYLMVHLADGTARFTGLERIVGAVGGRSGTFVLEHSGAFVGGVATAAWTVVPGSGTGDLTGLRGDGGFSSGHAEEYDTTLTYRFE